MWRFFVIATDGRCLRFVRPASLKWKEERSVYSYLSFFELGADGKMHEITNSISNDSSLSLALFPGVQREYDRWVAEGKGDWEFVLPRKGKTILVRAPKTKKILHKFTWTGEKFEKEK